MDNNMRLILCLLVVLCGTFLIGFRWRKIEEKKRHKKHIYFYK